MKRVGIITMHGVWNYGSALQAYATCRAINRLGYEAEIINYRFPNEYHSNLPRKKKREAKISLWQLRLNGLCSRLIGVSLDKRLERLASFFKHYVPITKPYERREELAATKPDYDIYVTGSDQVWNPLWVGEDTSFLLEWVPDEKMKIAYAASFGVKELPELYKENYKRLLQRYDHISVREESSIIYELTGKRPKVTLDPTFLLSKQEWAKLTPQPPIVKGDYILCYLLRYTFDPFPYAEDVIKHVRKQTGIKKVVMIGPEATYILNGYKVLPNCGPLEFLNLFYNASYVITSSFHGTSFAINFRKDFISITDNENTSDNRQVSLVKLLGLNEECLLAKETSLSGLPIPRIDYSAHEETIEKTVNASMQYLENALKD